jgi:AcrR family transcriptional regulator
LALCVSFHAFIRPVVPYRSTADVCGSAGLAKRYFYESVDSIDQLCAAVVDHAIDVMVERTEPFRPGTAGGSVHTGIKAFIDALLDDRRLARILITETQAGSLSRFAGRIVDVAAASFLPLDQLARTKPLDRRRLIAYAQIGPSARPAWPGTRE